MTIFTSELLETGLIIMSGFAALKLYLNSEMKKAELIEEEKTHRARVYADRDIRSSQIEANAGDFSGGQSAAEQGILQQVLPLVMQNPGLLSSILGKVQGGNTGIPATFQEQNTNMADTKNNIK